MTRADIGKRIGNRLRALREAANTTQEAVAERTGPRGLGVETVSRYERGMRIPTLETISNLATAVGSDFDEFLAGVINVEPVDRVELRRIVVLLEPLSDEHLRVIRAMLVAHLEGVAVAKAEGAAKKPTR